MVGTGKLTENAALDASGLVAIAICYGFALFVAVSIAANHSGGHVNPAVTFGLVGKLKIVTGVFYWVAQLLSSTLACYLLKYVTGGLAIPIHSVAAGVGSVQGVLMEIIITFALVYTVTRLLRRFLGQSGDIFSPSPFSINTHTLISLFLLAAFPLAATAATIKQAEARRLGVQEVCARAVYRNADRSRSRPLENRLQGVPTARSAQGAGRSGSQPRGLLGEPAVVRLGSRRRSARSRSLGVPAEVCSGSLLRSIWGGPFREPAEVRSESRQRSAQSRPLGEPAKRAAQRAYRGSPGELPARGAGCSGMPVAHELARLEGLSPAPRGRCRLFADFVDLSQPVVCLSYAWFLMESGSSPMFPQGGSSPFQCSGGSTSSSSTGSTSSSRGKSVSSSGSKFVDIEGVEGGHDICRDGDTMMSGVVMEDRGETGGVIAETRGRMTIKVYADSNTELELALREDMEKGLRDFPKSRSTPESLKGIKLRCGVSGLEFRVPEPHEHLWDAPASYICLYKYWFEKCELWLLLPDLLCKTIAFTQLCPGAIQNIVGEIIVGESNDISVSLRLLEAMSNTTGFRGTITLQIEPNRKIIRTSWKKDHNWMDCYFFVRVMKDFLIRLKDDLEAFKQLGAKSWSSIVDTRAQRDLAHGIGVDFLTRAVGSMDKMMEEILTYSIPSPMIPNRSMPPRMRKICEERAAAAAKGKSVELDQGRGGKKTGLAEQEDRQNRGAAKKLPRQKGISGVPRRRLVIMTWWLGCLARGRVSRKVVWSRRNKETSG
ncbi:unnamed protein product, partial [Thlaspi arvense]